MTTEQLIPCASHLVESTRSVGYSFETSIADIIDNSISKKAARIDILFDSNTPQYVAIVDDGIGMNADELKQAMRYGSKSSEEKRATDDLGRFGLGLKMASLSQCRKLTLISKCNNEINGACWNLNRVYHEDDWTIELYSEEDLKSNKFISELKNYDSGTIVLWEDFDRLESETHDIKRVFDEKIASARNHIRLVFHRFLDPHGDARRISIYMNGIAVEAIDPYLLSNSATQRLEEEKIPIGDDYILVKPFVLPYASKLTKKEQKLFSDNNDIRHNQGFYIYRNKRLIVWGTWMRLIKTSELHKLARIRVDIPNSMDSMWNIDIKKSTAALPDTIKSKLKDIVLRAVGTSERVFKYRGRKVKDNLIHVWETIEERDKIFRYFINRNLPLYKALVENLDDENQRRLEALLSMVEDTFPYGDVYIRQAKEETIGRETDENVLFRNGLYYVDTLISLGSNTQRALNSLDRLDYFSGHKDVIAKIKAEYDL